MRCIPFRAKPCDMLSAVLRTSRDLSCRAPSGPVAVRRSATPTTLRCGRAPSPESPNGTPPGGNGTSKTHHVVVAAYHSMGQHITALGRRHRTTLPCGIHAQHHKRRHDRRGRPGWHIECSVVAGDIMVPHPAAPVVKFHARDPPTHRAPRSRAGRQHGHPRRGSGPDVPPPRQRAGTI